MSDKMSRILRGKGRNAHVGAPLTPDERAVVRQLTRAVKSGQISLEDVADPAASRRPGTVAGATAGARWSSGRVSGDPGQTPPAGDARAALEALVAEQVAASSDVPALMRSRAAIWADALRRLGEGPE